MKRISELALMLVLLAMAACNGSGTSDKNRPVDGTDPGQNATAELQGGGGDKGAVTSSPAGSPADLLSLSEVRIGPDRVTADVDLSAEAIVIPPVPEEIEFEYRWFVSNQEVADARGPILKSGSFRKNQWVICEARAVVGEKTSLWLKSDWVRIANSPPQIEPVAVDGFTVPGRFTCQLKASDVDNDPLTYELISPLDLGIELDKRSGLLTWNLDQATVAKLGESIDISLSVSDNDGQPTTGSITLRFQKRTEKKNP